jgi:hypothetical protein
MKKIKLISVVKLNKFKSNNEHKFEPPFKQYPDTSEYEYLDNNSNITLNVASATANAFQSLYVL